MNLTCLCNWDNHEHHWPNYCSQRALMYLWHDGKTYQLCPICVDAIEAWRIIKDAPYDARLYMVDEKPQQP